MEISRTWKMKIFIPVAIIFSGALILFIASSFLDLKMMDFFSRAEQSTGMKYFIAIEDEVGIGFPLYALFICFAILLESLFKFLKYKAKENKKQRNWASIHENWFLWTYYGLAAFIFLGYWTWNLIIIPNQDDGFGAGNDIKLLGPKIIREVGTIFATVFTIIILAGTIYNFRFKYKDSNSMLTKHYWQLAAKIIIFIGYSYFMIGLFKRVWGRPYYFSVVFDGSTHDSGHGSIQDIINELGWTRTKDTGWGNGQYLEWWDPNNLKDNLQNWFKPRSEYWTATNDQWWNMDFPSGHTTGETTFLSLGLFFVYNDPKKSKIKWHHTLFFTFFLLELLAIQYALVVYRFHWVSDVSFSVVVAPLLYYLAHLTATSPLWRLMFYYERKYISNDMHVDIVISNSQRKNVKIVVTTHSYTNFIWKTKTFKMNKDKEKYLFDKVEDKLKTKNITFRYV